MRLALLTSPGAHNKANFRRMHGLAKALADEQHSVVQLPAPAKRRALRQRIVGVMMPSPKVEPTGNFPLREGLRHLPWAMRVALRLQKYGPFDAVLTMGAGSACAAALTYCRTKNIPWLAYASQGPKQWRVAPLYKADKLLYTSARLKAQAQLAGFDPHNLIPCVPFYDPQVTTLSSRRRQVRRELSISSDRFVSVVMGEARGGRGALIAEVSGALSAHGTFLTLLPHGHGGGRGMRVCPESVSELDSLAAADVIWFVPEDRGLALSEAFVGALASGRPVLMMADAKSQSAQMLSESEGGMVLSPHDGAALRVATFGMWADQQLAEKMAGKAQMYMEKHHSARAMAQEIVNLLST